MQETSPPITLADSITAVPVEGLCRVVVCGSHGGLYSAGCALQLGVPAVLFSDAGLGLEGAGIAGLALLQSHGVPGAAVSHDSARIGDAADLWKRGRISALNEAAKACGVGEGMGVRQACALLPAGRRPPVSTAAPAEARHAVTDWEGVPIWLLDSNSLVGPGDVGAIVVTGSHGGLLGGRPETAIKQPVFAAFYNDAGVGIDGAGISRLPALEQSGIAGIAVAAMTARIGDGRSTYEDGIVSFVNDRAAAFGVRPGMRASQAVEALALAWIFSNPTRTSS